MSETIKASVTSASGDKECARCNVVKPMEEFQIRQKNPIKFSARCKACLKELRVNKAGTKLVAEKKCCTCGIIKPRESFGIHRLRIDGINCECRDCMRQKTLVRRSKVSKLHVTAKKCVVCNEVKPSSEFQKSLSSSRDGLTRRCKECTRWYQIERHYGLTKSQYSSMFMAQKGLCAICQEPSPDGLVVDHHHGSDAVRKLLCPTCNSGLGMFKEKISILERAIAYLKEYSLLGVLEQEQKLENVKQ